MQQYNLEVFGSADSQKSFSIDGLKTNWPGAAGGSTMQYYGFEMYDEYNMQTASGTAESDVAGVYMNMVTKSGTNQFRGDTNYYFMNDSLQGDNVDDELRLRLGLQPGQRTGAAGNPIDISYDWSATFGGPMLKDRVFFFAALPALASRPVPDWRHQSGRLAGHRRQPHRELHGQGVVADRQQHQDVVPVQSQSQVPLPPPGRALSLRRGQGLAAAGSAGAELRRPVQPCDPQHDGGRRPLRPDVGTVPEPVSVGGRPG